MSIFPLFDPETTLTSRFFTATFLYNRLFPGHKAESSHNPYYTAADSHIFLPAHMEAGRDKTAALAAVDLKIFSTCSPVDVSVGTVRSRGLISVIIWISPFGKQLKALKRNSA